MQVTNERAALEAALGAGNGSAPEIIKALRLPIAEMKCDCVRCRAAACIEDLAAALKPFAQIEIGITDKEAVDMEDWFRHGGDSLTVGDFRRARVILEGWGLK